MTNQTTDLVGFSPDLSWSLLLEGQPWEAALPSSLSDARLDHLSASCQPDTKCRPLAHILMSHLVKERARLTTEQPCSLTALTDEGYGEAREELVKLIVAERDVRLAKKRFLAVLDAVVGAALQESIKPSEPDCDDQYRAAYGDDEASLRLKQMQERIERASRGINTA